MREPSPRRARREQLRGARLGLHRAGERGPPLVQLVGLGVDDRHGALARAQDERAATADAPLADLVGAPALEPGALRRGLVGGRRERQLALRLDGDRVELRLVGADLAARRGGLRDDAPAARVGDDLAAAVAREPQLRAEAARGLVAVGHHLQRHGVLDHLGRHAELLLGRRRQMVGRAAEHGDPGGERDSGCEDGDDSAHGDDNRIASAQVPDEGAKPSLSVPVLSPMSRICLLALMALLALPVSAHAAEGFVGVTERGSVVRFTTEAPYGLTTPKRPVGMAPGERILALGRGERGVVAVGSSARLYALDPVTARATAIGPSFPQGLRGSRFSLAAAPNSDSARLLSDVGQDLVVDLRTGATTDGPGLRRERDGSAVRPAADLTPQGALFGVQINPAVYLRELAARHDDDGGEPAGDAVRIQPRRAGGVLARRERQGRTWSPSSPTGSVIASPRSSRSTRRPAATRRRAGREVQTFGRRLVTFTSLGTVPDDHTAPKVRVTAPAPCLGARAARPPGAAGGALERGRAADGVAPDRRAQRRLRLRHSRHAPACSASGSFFATAQGAPPPAGRRRPARAGGRRDQRPQGEPPQGGPDGAAHPLMRALSSSRSCSSSSWPPLPPPMPASTRRLCASSAILRDSPEGFVIGRLYRPQRLRYIRRSANRRWALVRTRSGLAGWIRYRSLCRVKDDRRSSPPTARATTPPSEASTSATTRRSSATRARSSAAAPSTPRTSCRRRCCARAGRCAATTATSSSSRGCTG